MILHHLKKEPHGSSGRALHSLNKSFESASWLRSKGSDYCTSLLRQVHRDVGLRGGGAGGRGRRGGVGREAELLRWLFGQGEVVGLEVSVVLQQLP